MSEGGHNDERWLHTRNSARFFVEQRHIGWVLLVATLVWGVWAWHAMPQRKDPEIPVRAAAVLVAWPGASAERVEERITRRVEEAVGGNKWVEKIESVSRTGLSVVTLHLHERVAQTDTVLDDIGFRLQEVGQLPDGAGPLTYIKDFGDTSTLMLTVASPRVSGVELDMRAVGVARAVRALRNDAAGEARAEGGVMARASQARVGASGAVATGRRDVPRTGVAKAEEGTPLPAINDAGAGRMAVAWVAPSAMDDAVLRRLGGLAADWLVAHGDATAPRLHTEPGLVVLDVSTRHDAAALSARLAVFRAERVGANALHPDLWEPAVFASGDDARAALEAVAADRYSWRDLEAYTEKVRATLERLGSVGKVSRWGVRPETIFIDWSQERLASLGLDPQQVAQTLAARNTSLPGGQLETRGRGVLLDSEGELRSATDLAEVMVATSASGAPLYLRDVADVTRSYRAPVENLNHFVHRDADGTWRRGKAITLAVEMRSGEHIDAFSREVDAALGDLTQRLPEDLLVVRTSDQPRQVTEKVDLFTLSLEEAVVLVVAVAFIGFREWRSALLMALSIPLTLAMTFGMMHLLGIDLQQISIASLILALGLLVDDPVVAGDAIKREIAEGRPRRLAAWLGPTKLARAILYATITNIVAYLPFLLLTGDKGRFLYSMPIVVACSLVASRIVSMTFIPLLGSVLLDAGRREGTVEERRARGLGRLYYAVGGWAIDHRWKVLAGSLLLVVAGFWLQGQLKPQFFPKDRSYLSYVDLWLPEDATVEATARVAADAARIVTDRVAAFDAETGRAAKGLPPALRSVTVFTGGGGPRFWFSVTPELRQPNYAQLLVEVSDNHLTKELIGPLQQALSERLPSARADVMELENGPPIGVPVQLRLYGDDIPALRAESERLKAILRADPDATRVKDNWGADTFVARLRVDPDKAALSGVTMLDVARATGNAATGTTVTALREGRLTVPVVSRLRPDERADATDVEGLYVAGQGGTRVPLAQIAEPEYGMETARIFRRNQQRCVVISCFPREGVLPSEVVARAMPAIGRFRADLPPGFRLEFGGEHEEQVKGFKELAGVMGISIAMIYMALLFQFRNAVKPLIVFAAIPYGMTGAFAALRLMGQPFGFMAFLGIASLIGVIVSHIIVLFDFIEEKREEGEDLRTALLDAGIVRLRPVMITVAATVIALFPLALHGGALWEPLCYAQAGGLTVATFVTLLMVPVLYAIAVLDLKVVK